MLRDLSKLLYLTSHILPFKSAKNLYLSSHENMITFQKPTWAHMATWDKICIILHTETESPFSEFVGLHDWEISCKFSIVVVLPWAPWDPPNQMLLETHFRQVTLEPANTSAFLFSAKQLPKLALLNIHSKKKMVQ